MRATYVLRMHVVLYKTLCPEAKIKNLLVLKECNYLNYIIIRQP